MIQVIIAMVRYLTYPLVTGKAVALTRAGQALYPLSLENRLVPFLPFMVFKPMVAPHPQ